MLMQTAPIPRDHSFVLVMRDTLEMEPLVLVNESFPSCWSSLAVRFILRCHENNFSVFLLNRQISRNVQLMLTTVMLMLTVLIPEDHSTARVIRDILEMESLVLVK